MGFFAQAQIRSDSSDNYWIDWGNFLKPGDKIGDSLPVIECAGISQVVIG